MQLVAYGAQDIYLTGNPMITYFKVVYRRHTNFAMESIEQTFNGSVGFGNRVSALISRNGDLINGVVLEATLPAAGTGKAWIQNVGHYLMREVIVEIGGQQIDKHYGDWLEIWSQLTIPAGQKAGYLEMIGQSPTDLIGQVTGFQNRAAQATGKIYVPLQFWFCRNVGLALPLIALQYHEVKITIQFEELSKLTSTAATGLSLSASLWVDYIYLDTDERRRFAQVSHEYLIEQLQYTGDEVSPVADSTVSPSLSFNHPVKELIWVCRETDNRLANYTTAVSGTYQAPITDATAVTYTVITNAAAINDTRPTGGINPVASARLQLNGHDRMATRSGSYYNLVQCKNHHTNIPTSPGINVYSFALKPEDHQPSGTCNFSRIDNAKLTLTGNAGAGAGVLKIFAVNYNVLRIMSGMGGLAYSN